MTLVDSHAHLFLEEFDADRPEVMRRARDAGVTHIFMPNIDSSTIAPLLKTCRDYPGLAFPMIGLHPTSITAQNLHEELDTVSQWLDRDDTGFVAVGEIGMDLYWDQTFINEQITALRTQVSWASDRQLPIVLHCRQAYTYIYKVLQPYRHSNLTGIFHSFTGDINELESMLTFDGFCIGINGVATFKKSPLPQLLPRIPLDRLVLETDAPYLTPTPHRGKRNESAYLIYTLQVVAQAYGLPPKEVAQACSNNALRVFKVAK